MKDDVGIKSWSYVPEAYGLMWVNRGFTRMKNSNMSHYSNDDRIAQIHLNKWSSLPLDWMEQYRL